MGDKNEFDLKLERELSDAKRWEKNSSKSRVLRPMSDSISNNIPTSMDSKPEYDIIKEFISILLSGHVLPEQDRREICKTCKCSANASLLHTICLILIGTCVGVVVNQTRLFSDLRRVFASEEEM